MKISTKGRYAIALMLDLAENDTGEYIPMNAIAVRQGISVKYLEQIISVINKAGFVKGVRGSQGGYKLTKRPEEYTVGMILRLMEGDLSPVPESELEDNSISDGYKAKTRFIWTQLNDAVNSVVDNITLEDIINEAKKEIGYDYCI